MSNQHAEYVCVVCLVRDDTRFNASMVLDGHSLCDEHARHLASGIPIRVLLGSETVRQVNWRHQ